MYKDKIMWYIKFVIIPVIIGATGIVSKGSKKNLEAIPGRQGPGVA
jgi:hypothetical protein